VSATPAPGHHDEALAHLRAADPVMAGLVAAVGRYGLEPETHCPPFEALARAIAHQQLHGAAARAILARLVAALGEGGFPAPDRLLAEPPERLRALGFSAGKVAALRDLAAKTLDGSVPPLAEMAVLTDEQIIARVTRVRGIGRWTVEMMLMFQLGRPDVLPVDDFGVRTGFRLAYRRRALPKPAALARYGERWSPSRTAAAWYLWRAVDLARAGSLPPPPVRIRLPARRAR
jgi:DNA-3-methyladenine glycosylase II